MHLVSTLNFTVQSCCCMFSKYSESFGKEECKLSAGLNVDLWFVADCDCCKFSFVSQTCPKASHAPRCTVFKLGDEIFTCFICLNHFFTAFELPPGKPQNCITVLSQLSLGHSNGGKLLKPDLNALSFTHNCYLRRL